MTVTEKIWSTLFAFLCNPYGTAGLMGNIQAESGFDPGIVEKRSGLTGKQYLDSITRDSFLEDGYGFGLCQWSYKEHKARLYDEAMKAGKKLDDLDFQLSYIIADLKRFSAVLATLRTAVSVKEASDDVMCRYLKPADQSEKAKAKRASYGQGILDKYAGVIEMTKPMIVIRSAKSRLGHPYVFAARGEKCTPDNRRKYIRSDYPNIVEKCQVLNDTKSTCSGCKYNGGCIYDCRGFTYRCMLDAGIMINGAGATSQWENKGNWLVTGTTDNMPDVVCCLFKRNGSKMSHTGLHIGSGRIIHCSGEVKTDSISSRTWTHWAVPIGLYTEKEIKEAGRIKAVSSLKQGSKGDAVRALQENLNRLGYNCGSVDGKFGAATEKAVKLFQSDHGLTVDGIAGSLTQAALEEALGKGDAVEKKLTLEERVEKLEKAVFGG